MSSNDRTVQAYDDHIEAYINSMSPVMSEDVKLWIDRVLKQIPTGGKVLELGSGAGRDASYIESHGFEVLTTDAAPGFVDKLRRDGHQARLLNALTDDYGSGYDLVLANAVLLHFSPIENKRVLQKAYQSLKPGGSMAFSVKQGEGSAWLTEKIDDPRQFYFWQKADLEKFLEGSHFKIIEIAEGQSRKASWYYVTLRKD